MIEALLLLFFAKDAWNSDRLAYREEMRTRFGKVIHPDDVEEYMKNGFGKKDIRWTDASGKVTSVTKAT